MKGVILYGSPASGKTSVAEALEGLDPRYVTFRRLKAGGGRTDGYRVTTIEAINALEARGDIMWRNDRYGATYAVDKPTLLAQLPWCSSARRRLSTQSKKRPPALGGSSSRSTAHGTSRRSA